MRTALVLLLLLALAAIPGSVIPQEGVDSLKTSRWQDGAPDADAGLREARAVLGLRLGVVLGDLPPADGVAGRLHRAAHVPTTGAALRAAPPRAPRNLTRLPDHASYRTTDDVDDVLAARRGGAEAARATGVRADDDGAVVAPSAATCARPATCSSTSRCWWCWSGFAVGGLFGYKGGVILVGRQRLLQQPHAVRRLRPRQPVPARRHGAVLLRRRRLRRRLADRRAARRDGAGLRRRT